MAGSNRGPYVWDSDPCHVTLPAPSPKSYVAGTPETVNSEQFNVPRGAFAMTIHVPTLASGGDTVKLQSLASQASDQETDAWRDLSVFNPADGTRTAIDELPSNSATTIPCAVTGGGVMRFTASADQSASPVSIRVAFLITR